MKLAIFGGTGNIGSRIIHEAMQRGHQITPVVRDFSKVKQSSITLKKGDVIDSGSIAEVIVGYNAVISAVGPRPGDPSGPAMLSKAAHALIDGLKRAKVRRLIIVGGAGSLEVTPGRQLVDSPEFPAAWRGVALAHRDAQRIFEKEKDLDWTVLSPAALIQPGQRTGHYRTGTNQLIKDAAGKSVISMEDYAAALLDELESPKHIRQRFTVGY